MEVGYTNGLDQAFIDEGLEGLIGFLDTRFGLDDLSLEVGPARRVGVSGVNVFKGDREVNVEEVKVIDTPPFKLLPRDRFNALLLMESIPQLRCDE